MSVLKKYFDKGVNQSSPIQKDYDRKVDHDENGNEFITWVEVDYQKIQDANGNITDWSLNNLLSAGINPNFPISTGLNTRLEGIGVVDNAAAYVEQIFADSNINIEEK